MTPKHFILKLQQFVVHKGYELNYKLIVQRIPELDADLIGRSYACGLIEVRKGLDDERHAAVLVHEIAHEMLHYPTTLAYIEKEREADYVTVEVLRKVCGLEADTIFQPGWQQRRLDFLARQPNPRISGFLSEGKRVEHAMREVVEDAVREIVNYCQ